MQVRQAQLHRRPRRRRRRRKLGLYLAVFFFPNNVIERSPRSAPRHRHRHRTVCRGAYPSPIQCPTKISFYVSRIGKGRILACRFPRRRSRKGRAGSWVHRRKKPARLGRWLPTYGASRVLKPGGRGRRHLRYHGHRGANEWVSKDHCWW
ncbi:hypothetical protein BZA05DRAFT_275443 [Tricharina praecox]|uniref:uncharacterized protein n=1 Tax=Tricharina praecox TaxID=43433 RepID=UPI0022204910|nr:uncharacterized protein BZA05DRAFT_275443 [Tricharina praecox]KAI5853959.1 hypothetical protein BZA05DRAFT_275443 [Tricharina praecox]